MKINPTNTAAGFGKITGLNIKKPSAGNKAEKAVDQFISGNSRHEKVLTYNKHAVRAVKADSTTIARLQKESEEAYAPLKQIVAELLEKQGYSVQQVKDAWPAFPEIEIDEATRIEAASLIADDGPLGAEAVSKRIVDFAIAVSGGDKSKLPELKGAIEKGFEKVKDMLGSLPEVSLKTYDLVMEKLDRWEKEA